MKRFGLIVAAVLGGAVVAVGQTAPVDPRVADIARSGKLRVALFMPQYTKDPATGGIHGLGVGVIALETVKSLATRLGVEMLVVEEPGPQKAVECLTSKSCDLVFLGIEAERRREVDFTPAIVQFDYTYLVPPGSTVRDVAEIDQLGARIVTVRGHAAAIALGQTIKRATIVTEDSPAAAFALVQSGKADAFALPREVLLHYSSELQGSRVLEGAYGRNLTGIAIAKGQQEHLAYFSEFFNKAKASGMIQKVIDENGMRGFQVASRANPMPH